MKISKKVLSILLCTVMILGSLAVGGEGFIDALVLLSVKASVAQCGIFTYELYHNNAIIIGCDSSASGEITIPSTLDGYPVTSIGDYAFDDCGDLTSIHIPDSVTSIGKNAFSTCFSLTSIHIPDSVTSIGENAFSTCFSLTSVTIGSGVTSIGDYAFYNCISLTSIHIPDSVTSIGDYAFYSCSSLTSIHIPDSVTSIGENAFDYCFLLTSVCIPGSIEIINSSAFDHCISLGDVYFTGSEEQELNIEYGNEPLTGATWHYNYVHTYTVTKESTCTEAGSKIINCECGAFTKSIPPLGHDYAVTYEWSADGKTCTAAATCKNNANHVVTENAVITSAVKEKPACEKKGTETYTASYTNELFSTQTKDIEEVDALGHDYVNHEAKAPTCMEIGWDAYQTCKRCDYTSYKEIPPLGHDYAVTYEWSADGKTCTATATCKNNANHVVTENATITSAVKEEPACEKKGTETYTASFTNELFSTQTKDIEEVDALGHDYVNHEAKAPNCEEIGWEAYQTCKRCDYTSYKEIPPLGHDYAVTYEWSADGRTCTATATCKNNANHVVTENAVITSAVKVQPTCEEKGTATYTASFTHEPFTAQTKDVEDIDALGHTDEDNDGMCDICREIINAEANKAFLESKIALNIPGEATVRFRNKAAVTVTADNLPEGYTIAIYDGDTLLAQSKPGEDSVTYTTGELQKAVTLTVKVLDKDGNAVTGKTGEIKVNVNKNIFTIVIALILGIFRKLPTVTVKP